MAMVSISHWSVCALKNSGIIRQANAVAAIYASRKNSFFSQYLFLRMQRIRYTRYTPLMMNGRYPIGPRSKILLSVNLKTIPVGIETAQQIVFTAHGTNRYLLCAGYTIIITLTSSIEVRL